MRESEQIHLAIIPDGNRRWARKQAMRPWKGHEQGMHTARKLIDWGHDDARIHTFTLWGLSTENWNRPKKELSELMKIYEAFLIDERAKFAEKNTKLIHSGRLDRIPESLRKLILEIVEETKNNEAFILNFALDYGGKDDLLRAIQKVKDPKNISAESFEKLLDLNENTYIDIVVRTSGEQRTSNFFMWQAAYAEWFFLPMHFPELTSDDLDKVVTQFFKRHRRFGK